MSNFLTKDFEPSSSAAWKQKIQFDLEGADYNQTLLTSTNEGITIKPFYHSDTFEKLDIPVPKENCKPCLTLEITTEEESNKIAVDSLKKGFKSIKFIAKNPFNFEALFKDLLGKKIDFHFKFNFLSSEFIDELSSKLNNETTYFNIDIIGNLAKTGNWHNSLNHDFKTLEAIIRKNNSAIILSVNADIYQNAGANTVQQVAYSLAHLTEYLTFFGGEITNQIQFNFAIGSNFFFEISKLRAFRYLFKLILNEYNISAEPKIFTQPSLRNKSLFTHKTNKLRVSSESLSAVIGGATTVSVDTNYLFYKSINDNNYKNQLIELTNEQNFKNAKYIATESYYLETITKQIAEKALELFKNIEKSGGFLKQLKEGTIQRKIKENAQKEQEQFNKGKLILSGVNKFFNDKDINDLQVKPLLKSKPYKTLIQPINPKRLAENLEQKRIKNEA